MMTMIDMMILMTIIGNLLRIKRPKRADQDSYLLTIIERYGKGEKGNWTEENQT